MKIVQIELPETSHYIHYGYSTSSQFVSVANESSLISGSLDQVMKHSIILTPGSIREEIQRDPIKPDEISAP